MSKCTHPEIRRLVDSCYVCLVCGETLIATLQTESEYLAEIEGK